MVDDPNSQEDTGDNSNYDSNSDPPLYGTHEEMGPVIAIMKTPKAIHYALMVFLFILIFLYICFAFSLFNAYLEAKE